jgi:hypothetical protein
MISIVGTGEEEAEEEEEEEEEDTMGSDTVTDRMEDPEDEDEFEVASLYPASQLHHGAMSTYRSAGGHFVTGDSRITSDL